MNSNLKLLLVIFLLTLCGKIVAQYNISKKLYDLYPQFKEEQIENKRFSHKQMMDVLQGYSESKLIEIKTMGHSIEGRDIKLFRIGRGKTNVLAWSQMHGDESTATMSLLDILKFFTSDNKEFESFRKFIVENISFYFIPMLNPDGAEKFRRRNEMYIDINRDAQRLQFPESKILKNVVDSIKPIFAFNLHDQNPRYTVGNSYKVAAISFLAPAFNYEKDINDVRENSMKLISYLKKELDHFIPGHVAKYNDDFEPRAFGDNVVKWGSSVVLVESGGWDKNNSKQFLRKINFIILLSSLNSIASQSYAMESLDGYASIPENEEKLFDLLLKNITITKNNVEYVIDIGINHNARRVSDNNKIFFEGSIQDIGDLSIYFGSEEFDCEGLKLEKAQVFPTTFRNLDELAAADVINILAQGYSFVQVDSIETNVNYTSLPINILKKETKEIGEFWKERSANFILTKNDKIAFVCVNGFLFDPQSDRNYIKNGKIYK